MPRLEGRTSSMTHRPGTVLLAGLVAAVAMLLVTACGGAKGDEQAPTSDVADGVSDGTDRDGFTGQDAAITLYRSPT